MDDLNNPSVPVPGDNDVIPSEGNENVVGDNSNTSPEVVSLKELVKQATGREYKSDEEALAGIKETYKFATSRTPQNTTSADPAALEALRQRVEISDFYAENSDMKPHKDLIETFATAKGISRDEVVKDEEFKGLIGKLKIADEVQSSKSVLESNPRLGLVRNKIDEAREALKSGDVGTARSAAVGSVLEAYEKE